MGGKSPDGLPAPPHPTPCSAVPFPESQTFPLVSAPLRISRLFSDAKKILLYSQNDKNLEGFKELSHALHLLQTSRSGRCCC